MNQIQIFIFNNIFSTKTKWIWTAKTVEKIDIQFIIKTKLFSLKLNK